MAKRATFSFRGELNDFLPPARRHFSFTYKFQGKPSLKDAIEAIGAPHGEIDVIIRNGVSASFGEHLADMDAVVVLPRAEGECITGGIHLIPQTNSVPRFVLDVHLGKLAVYLRLLGFDTLHNNHLDDPAIAAYAKNENRIVLTRDVALLKNGAISRCRWIRSLMPREQLAETIRYFELRPFLRPFTRCTVCNGAVTEVSKEIVRDLLKPETSRYYHDFYRCSSCGKVYWKGSHYPRLMELIEQAEHISPEPPETGPHKKY